MAPTRLGKWQIDKEIGKGGMGRVFLAHDDTTQAAIKVLSAELAQEAGFLERFRREIEALRTLEHPNIVRFYESGVEGGHFYYAMEYVDGQDFEELLWQQQRIPWRDVLDAALQIAPALKHAHDRGIVHRDLKPPNLLRTSDGIVKLADFGIAKIFSQTQLTTPGGVVGTAEFMSPEQAAGKPVTKRSDLYSLGAVLYTLLVGRPPFEGPSMVDIMHKHRYAQFDPPMKVVAEIPYEVDQVVCQLLEKDPADRPQDAMVLHRQLDAIRRKLDRKANQTVGGIGIEGTRVDPKGPVVEMTQGPGPATLMSQMMREHLAQEKMGGPITRLLNNVWVLLPMFLVCVGILVWSFFFKSDPPAPEGDTANEAKPIGWYRLELAKSLRSGGIGVAQRIYEQGAQAVKADNRLEAVTLWTNLVIAFDGVSGEQQWVRLAKDGLDKLAEAKPLPREVDAGVLASLHHANELRREGKKDDANRIYRALETLLANDPRDRELLKKVREQARE